MSWLEDFIESSIGKKSMVALAGLLLCGFLVAHLAGNLLLIKGEGAFNHYAEALEANPLLIVAEIGLLVLFLGHIIVALVLTAQNKKARPVAYQSARSKGGRTAGSRSMAVSGVLLLAFLVIHLKGFRFTEDEKGLYHLVTSTLAKPGYAVFYFLAMGGLGLHLSHGFQSAFQTFGVNHPRYTPLIKKAGWAFAAAIAGGFAVLPVWAYFKGVCQ